MAISESINLAPGYQRRDRWDATKQSALIESFILNVPVPPVYLSEDDFGKYSIIDGKQRITAIRDFLAGNLRLKKLNKFSELENYCYEDLPAEIRNALSVRPYIRVITLLKQTDPQLKYEVFLRLNTGGEKLLAQEIRNVAYSGPLNDLLFELSEVSFLRNRMKIKNENSSGYQKMDDVEHVLRFLTVREKWKTIGQELNLEMDEFMRANRMADAQRIAELKETFLFSLSACESIFGDRAFYKPTTEGWRSQFISPLFDAEMVGASLLREGDVSKIAKVRDDVLRSLAQVFKDDPQFVKSVSQSTNNPTNVKKRITTVCTLLQSQC